MAKLYVLTLVSIVLMLSGKDLFSQTILQGTITDSGSEPLQNALVELTDQSDTISKFSDYTDENGHYSIEILESGLKDDPLSNPTSFELLQNYPNPFHSSTIIAYKLTQPASVSIEVYNIIGCRIKTLVDGYQSGNTGWIVWDATDNTGQAVPPGVYVYSITVDGIKKARTMILLSGNGISSDLHYSYATGMNAVKQKGLIKSMSNLYMLRVSGDSIETYEQRDIEITGNKTLNVSVFRTISDIDGNLYRIIKIGNQWWTAQNLKVTRYRNGNTIPEITDSLSWNGLTTGAYCNYNNDPEFGATYGKLYNWHAVNDSNGLAPEGWHVASDKDWLTLELLLGDADTAGGQLKEKDSEHWQSPNTAATNSFEFAALPGGYRECHDGFFFNQGTYACFWGSTEYNSDSSWIRMLKHDSGELFRLNREKATGMSVRCVRGIPDDENEIYKGYYFFQDVSSYNMSMFGAISTAAEADSIINVISKHHVSGVEYGVLYFHPQDIAACIEVAKVFKESGIDLWLSSLNLQGNHHAFNNDVFPDQYRAYMMTPDGSIVPGFVHNVHSEEVIAFDVMNPEAVNWFINRYKTVFLQPMVPYTSGYFFNEDCLFYAGDQPNNSRINYWELAAYSDAVLQEWQKYCQAHSVTFNNEVVTKFPVHSESMVPNGGGKTQYFPGYNVPSVVEGGTQVVSLPRNTGVWAAWDDFVTSQYVKTWIGGISKAVYEVNLDNPDFKGVIYFGLHNWSLAYEEVTDPTFIVDSFNKWVPWGTQRGVKLSKICALPYVDHIICETFPPISHNMYKFISIYKQIASKHNKTFGVMLHRDDNWGLDGWDMEVDRWDAIQYFQPTIIARIPINRLFPTDQYYNEQKEMLFDERLLNYRK
ncbi:MAG: T9SS type A sorting domain-containing protein [Bacteroidales bacterium]|nr:T9SS type A sorting domain-containing protein [Bacteroidales bacterium]